MAEIGEEPPPVDEEPSPHEAFFSQEYFTNQGVIPQTQEGQAYFSAPGIRQWENVASLQAASEGQELADDADALIDKITWMTLASYDAQVRQQYLCHPQLVAATRVDRHAQELVFVAQLQAAAQTLQLSTTTALTRLTEESRGGRPSPTVKKLQAERATLKEALDRLQEAESGHEETLGRRQQEDARRRRSQTPAGGRRPQSPQAGGSRDVNAADGASRQVVRFEHFAEKHLNAGPAIAKYNYEEDSATWRRVTEHLADCERRFRQADKVSVVRPEHHLTAAQKRCYVLDNMVETTRRRVETELIAQRHRPLAWDPTRTVADLEDIWEFDVDSLTPPPVPRTLTGARNFPELVIAILPKGLRPQDRRDELDKFIASALDVAFDDSPEYVASRLRQLAEAIPRGEPQHISLDTLQGWLRQYVGVKRPSISYAIQQAYDDERAKLGPNDSVTSFTLYAEIAERHWASHRTHKADEVNAAAARRMATLAQPRRFGTAAVAAPSSPTPRLAPRVQVAKSHRSPSRVTVVEQDQAQNRGHDPDQEDLQDSSDDEMETVFAVADETSRFDFDSTIQLAAIGQLSAQELCAIPPPDGDRGPRQQLCWRCGRPGHISTDCPQPATDESRQREAFQRAQLFRYSRKRGGWRPQGPARFRNHEIISGQSGSPLMVISTEQIPYIVG